MNLLGVAVSGVFCLVVSLTAPINKSNPRGVFSWLTGSSLLSNELCCAKLSAGGFLSDADDGSFINSAINSASTP